MMNITVKKCDRCGKIYNLESRRETPIERMERIDRNSDGYVIRYEGTDYNIKDFFDIYAPNGSQLDLCYKCNSDLESFVINLGGIHNG